MTSPDSSHLVLTNGLISRQFLFKPNFGTVDYKSHTAGRSLLRSITAEATVTLDDHQYNIGGFTSPNGGGSHAYLNRSSLILEADPDAFQYVGHMELNPQPPFHWEPGLRFSPKTADWPPKGLHLQVNFKPPTNVKESSHAHVTISLHYEMYQGVPIMAKWLTVYYTNTTTANPVKINAVNVEYLAVQKPYVPWNYGPLSAPWQMGNGITGSWLYVETNQPHGTSIAWLDDPIQSAGASEPILVCSYYQRGPGVLMAKITGTSPYLTQFDSFRVIELVTDSDNRERVALSRHRLTRLLTPQTQENPIFFHSTNYDSNDFRKGIDQMVEVGFEMYIYSFGSGFNMERISQEYINDTKADIDYAHSKGIEVGG